jgi:ElaB/YqjD/DUF883 family membrane-anchored ribosome-binding protein
MTERTQDKELDALKAEMANLREELAGLVAGLTKSAGTKANDTHAEAEPAATGQENPNEEGQGHGAWLDYFQTINSSRIQGEKVVKDFAAEVERHPLLAVMVAFGLGYVIAKVWYKENKP